MQLESHEFACLIPDMTPEQYAQLVEDIGERGLLQPVVLYEGAILDGRNRYRACAELIERGHEPNLKFDTFEGTRKEAYAYVLSMNLHRRHLEYSQRAALASLWKRAIQAAGEVKPGRPEKGGGIATFTGKAREIAAEKFQVGSKAVDEAEKVADAAPDLFEQMVDGGIGLREAQREIRDRERRERAERLQQAGEMPSGKFRVIYADPPWHYNNSGVITENDNYGRAERHYPTMTIDQLCALDIKSLAEEDAVLFLWVTSPLLAECFAVIKAWSFTYKSSFVWDKVKHNFAHYNSMRHEFLLVCTRGSCTPDTKELHDSVITLERSDVHSEKPEYFREIIDKMYPHGNRIELFARSEPAENWEVWGNECKP